MSDEKKIAVSDLFMKDSTAVIGLICKGLRIAAECGISATAALAGGQPVLLASAVPATVHSIKGGISFVEKTLVDIPTRTLSEREQVRVGLSMYLALDNIWQHLINGDQLRDDYSLGGSSGRTPAEEILEGALLSFKNDHEEKKARYYANIPGNAAFDSDISPSEANLALRIVERLSYQQICLLALIVKQEELGFDSTLMRISQTRLVKEKMLTLPQVESTDSNWHQDNPSLYYELRELGRNGLDLIGYAENASGYDIRYMEEVSGPVHLNKIGGLCCYLMGINEFPTAELLPFVSIFTPCSEGPSE